MPTTVGGRGVGGERGCTPMLANIVGVTNLVVHIIVVRIVVRIVDVPYPFARWLLGLVLSVETD